MALRTGMDVLVAYLRSITHASTTDSFHGLTYWSDDQLQDVLDRNSALLRQSPLRADVQNVGGATDYTLQFFTFSPALWLEEATLSIRDVDGVVTATSYTLNVDKNSITFDSNPADKRWYATARLHDINAAAADVWGQKAAHRADYITWRAGQHRADREQEYKHCLQMQAYYKGKTVRGFRRKKTHFTVVSPVDAEVRPGG